MKIVFMGTPSFSVPILQALNEKYEIVLVVSQPDKERNRKKELLSTPVKVKAIELGLEVFQPQKIRQEYDAIIAKKADILVTAAYGQLIPEALLKSFKKCINVHASLLPKYRGGAPIQRSIINGDAKTGVTIMEMVKKMDAGDIYAQEEIAILDTDNNTSLFEKLSILGRDLLLKSIEGISNETIKGVEQDLKLVTFAYNILHNEELVCFNKPSVEVFNQIRGLAFEPGAYATINKEVFKIYSCQIMPYQGEEIPGTILSLKKEILVKTLDGAIRLTQIKPNGKNNMLAKDYVNGQKLINVGDVFL